MAKNINSYIQNLPKNRRTKIKARSLELIAEESTLQELRKALQCSQTTVAKKLRVNQAAVSKIERRADMYVSTLRSFIEAMGGRLDIVAQFPGSLPVHISQFRELE